MKIKFEHIFVPIVLLTIILFVAFYDADRDSRPQWKAKRALISGVKNVKFEKITSADQIPDLVMKSLKGLNDHKLLKRGAWCFPYEMFTTDQSYFMFCGGEEYGVGYDVEILKQWQGPSKYIFGEPATQKHISMTYCFKIKEVKDIEPYEYCKGFYYPFVLFKAEKAIAKEEGVYRVLTESNKEIRGYRATPWY